MELAKELFFHLHLLEIEELMVLFAVVKLAESFLINKLYLVLLIFSKKNSHSSEINPENNIHSECTKAMMSWACNRND